MLASSSHDPKARGRRGMYGSDHAPKRGGWRGMYGVGEWWNPATWGDADTEDLRGPIPRIDMTPPTKPGQRPVTTTATDFDPYFRDMHIRPIDGEFVPEPPAPHAAAFPWATVAIAGALGLGAVLLMKGR